MILDAIFPCILLFMLVIIPKYFPHIDPLKPPTKFPDVLHHHFCRHGTSMWSKAGTGKRHLGVHGDDLRRSENLMAETRIGHEFHGPLDSNGSLVGG